jgi:hypothetical protein
MITTLVTLSFLVIALISPMTVAAQESAPQETLQPSAIQIAVAKVVDQYSAEIMKLPGVWEVADWADPNDRTVTIRVMADKITPELISAIPPVLGGFPVVLGEGPRPIELGSASCCPVVAKPASKKDDSHSHP